MSTRILITVATLVLALSSCGNQGGNKPGRKMLIPDDKLVAILTDTYLTTGMMDLTRMRDTWAQRDSIVNYTDVISSHGYTLGQLNATMRYYFTDKPKKLARIYDRVTGNLLEMETMIMIGQGSSETTADENLWTGKASYSFPEDFTRDPVWFDMPAENTGLYVLSADIRLFEDDQSRNPRVTVFFSYTDSAGVEKRDYWDEFTLTKDGQFQSVTISLALDTIRNTRLRGWLLNHDNQPGRWEKHARIANISLRVDTIPSRQ
ncbi:MAG: DUF4296 domain-containing protein [Bacteroidales bacterium]|nr:DUF4296 domain-containing protein [Bacteroidales bacterium]